jgi:hypothetical protein
MNPQTKFLTRNKTIATIALILLLAFGAFAVLPITSAHDPAWNIPTYAYVTVSPNPVGVNERIFILFWLDKPPPGTNGDRGMRWLNLKIEITKPDGQQQTLGPYTSDPIGGNYATYTPDQIGTYTFKFVFPGQVATLAGPTGSSGDVTVYLNDTFLPSSKTVTLTVQQEKIPEPISYPLPTNYWTRPIEAQNIAWYAIASDWLGSPQIVGKFQPNGIAPNSPHIMWTKPFSFGGVAGGTFNNVPGANYYTGLSYEGKFTNPLVLYGRLYYNLPRSNDASGNGYICVDLRTGDEIFWQNMTQPGFGQLYDYESPNQHGIIPNGYLWRSVNDPRNGGTVWMAHDPMDGNFLFNLTNVPSGTTVYGPLGEILIYQMNYASRTLFLWNNTAAPGELLGTSGTNFWQWRPVGKNINASTAYSWNVTIPDLPGLASPAIIRVIPDDLIIGRSTNFAGFVPAYDTPNPYTLWAISLKPASRGQLLWIKNYTPPQGNTTLLVGPASPEARVLALYERETMRYWGISIDNGAVLWGPTEPESSLDFYQKFGANEVMTAYGRLYTASYGGIARCYDMKTGKLMWSYSNTSSGLASVWPNYPLGMGAIADDKVYLFTSEHSPNSPSFLGARVRCVNATTGAELWTMLSWASGFQAAGAAFAVAEGYLIYLNVYDMQIYCVGKGPSATTIDAPLSGVAAGSAITLRGTVTDQTQSSEAKDTPAISDQSMGSWMEYLYMQKPKPTDAAGIQVKITAVDPNGNTQNIGTTTSDANGNYGLMWTPPVEGLYKITATFTGSESYYPSDATTYLGVETAPSPAPTENPTPISTPTPIPPTIAPTATPSPSPAPNTGTGIGTEIYIAAAAAAVIAIVAAAALILRKRK